MNLFDSVFSKYVIAWTLTERVSLECRPCYIDTGMSREEPQGELTTGACLRIVDQIAEQCPQAVIHLTGEPLLRRDAFAVASHSGGRGLWPIFEINGVLVDERLVNRMKEHGVRAASLKLVSLDRAKHDTLLRVRGSWENVINGGDLLRRRGFPFFIETPIRKDNLPELEEIAAKAAQLGARVFTPTLVLSGKEGVRFSDLTTGEYDSVVHRLMQLEKNFSGKMVIDIRCVPSFQRPRPNETPESLGNSPSASGCPAGIKLAGINSAGQVTPCPFIPLYGGNLRDTTFESIWKWSEVFYRIRDRRLLGGRCGDCGFNSSCGGCRARAHFSTGNVMGDDPLCSYQSDHGKPSTLQNNSVPII